MLVRVAIVILISVGGFIWYFTSHQTSAVSDAEKQAALEKLLGHKVRTGYNGPEILTFTGKYISFSYPGSDTAYTNTDKQAKNNPMELESFQFQNRESGLFFTVDVRKSPTARTFTDISDVTFRQQHGYAETKGIIAGQAADIFTHEDSDSFQFEQTGFVLAKGNVYTFSGTGSDKSEVEKTFVQVTGSAKITH